MPLPLEVKQLCKQYLEKIRQTPEHTLDLFDSSEIIQAFSPARFDESEYAKHGQEFDYQDYSRFLKGLYSKSNVGDRSISWLSILTVKYALSKWDLVIGLDQRELKYLETVKSILRDAQNVLLGELEFEEALGKLNGEYWYFTHNFVLYDLACLDEAAIFAFATILYGCKYLPVQKAEEAYSAIDKNLPGEADSEEPPIPIEYEPDKRLEFWEWWLTEAIPEAWEIATRNSN